jgi:hypothetical protein
MARFNRIFSVYYPDRPSTELRLEAADHRSAAEQFFRQYPRMDDCLITVVPSGIFGNIVQVRTTEFMDEETRQSALAAAPPRPVTPTETPPSLPAERGSAAACVWIGIILLLIGAWFLVQPSTEMGQSFESSGFPALVNIHRLYIGQTCIIAGAIFLAAGIRPRSR